MKLLAHSRTQLEHLLKSRLKRNSDDTDLDASLQGKSLPLTKLLVKAIRGKVPIQLIHEMLNRLHRFDLRQLFCTIKALAKSYRKSNLAVSFNAASLRSKNLPLNYSIADYLSALQS